MIMFSWKYWKRVSDAWNTFEFVGQGGVCGIPSETEIHIRSCHTIHIFHSVHDTTFTTCYWTKLMFFILSIQTMDVIMFLILLIIPSTGDVQIYWKNQKHVGTSNLVKS